MPVVHKSPAARRDLVDHFAYLVENAGIEVGERFMTNAEASCHALAKNPKIGAPLTLHRAEFAGMRKWRVKEFDKFLIFYVPLPDRIFIVHVLHAAQDGGVCSDTSTKGDMSKMIESRL